MSQAKLREYPALLEDCSPEITVTAHLADQVDQDRREGGATCSLHLLPDGGSVDYTRFACGDLPKDSAAETADAGVTWFVPERNHQEAWSEQRGRSPVEYARPTTEFIQGDAPPMALAMG